jgi:hypothetical protein
MQLQQQKRNSKNICYSEVPEAQGYLRTKGDSHANYGYSEVSKQSIRALRRIARRR